MPAPARCQHGVGLVHPRDYLQRCNGAWFATVIIGKHNRMDPQVVNGCGIAGKTSCHRKNAKSDMASRTATQRIGFRPARLTTRPALLIGCLPGCELLIVGIRIRSWSDDVNRTLFWWVSNSRL